MRQESRPLRRTDDALVDQAARAIVQGRNSRCSTAGPRPISASPLRPSESKVTSFPACPTMPWGGLPALHAAVRRESRLRQAERFSPGDLLRGNGRRPTALHLPLQSAGQLHQRAAGRRLRLGGNLPGQTLVPRDGHHPRGGRQRGRDHERACAAAKKNGLTVSCDLNFRKKLLVQGESPAGDDRVDGLRQRPVHQRGGGGHRFRHRSAGQQRHGRRNQRPRLREKLRSSSSRGST